MNSKFRLALLGTVIALAMPVASEAQQWNGPPPGPGQYRPGPPNYQPGEWFNRHQGYLHALSDIRTAYWLIAHQEPNNPHMAGDEQRAQNELHAAYDELARAQVSDGRNIDDQPPPDMVFGSHRDRLHQAIELVRRAALSLEGEEDNPQAYSLRHNAREHLSITSRLIGTAMRDSRY